MENSSSAVILKFQHKISFRRILELHIIILYHHWPDKNKSFTAKEMFLPQRLNFESNFAEDNLVRKLTGVLGPGQTLLILCLHRPHHRHRELCKLVKNVTTNNPTKEEELSSRIILMRSDYFPGFLINIITLQRGICLEIDSLLIQLITLIRRLSQMVSAAGLTVVFSLV